MIDERIAQATASRTWARWHLRLSKDEAVQAARIGMMRCQDGTSAAVLKVAAFRGIMDEIERQRPIGVTRRGEVRLRRVGLPKSYMLGLALALLPCTVQAVTIEMPDSALVKPAEAESTWYKARISYPLTCYLCPTRRWWDAGSGPAGRWVIAGFGPGLYEIRRTTLWGWPCAPFARWTLSSGTWAGCLVFVASGPGTYRIGRYVRSGGGGRN